MQRALILLCATLILAGCGGSEPPYANRKTAGVAPSTSAETTRQVGEGVQLVASVPRRIIYTAEVELVAERLGDGEKALLQLVKAHNGYVSGTSVGGTPGEPRSGTWTVRIPVASYEAFMAALSRLGEVQRLESKAQDVTEEFTDVEARLNNKKREERRLQQHLERSTARLQDILAVERELSRVREEVERHEGRLRYLANQTDLTTITVTINEVKDYVPPRGTSFTAQIGRTFGESLGALRDTAEMLVLIAVALLPWIVILTLLVLPVALYLRRRWSIRSRGGIVDAETT